jgi:demethylmenaquinone methyltransferase/2-methoxy-6-polyprenyl-1,4-benzoquinol methylase
MEASNQNAANFAPADDDVFGRIADRYDLLCDVFSLGAHRLWKARMARRMAERGGSTVLDLASGTGDIPHRLLRRRSGESADRPQTLWVTDLSPSMLGRARNKLGADRAAVRFAIANAENLSDFADASVDLLSISFGMKICDRGRVLREAFRVLSSGGGFYCLEAARIPIPWLHATYLKYMDWCLPVIARLCARGDASAYDYLLRGVHGFPEQQTFAMELGHAGFTAVSYENLTFGIVALHSATKP